MISSKLIPPAEQGERERRPKTGFQQPARELDVGAKDKRQVRGGRREGVEERERGVGNKRGRGGWGGGRSRMRAVSLQNSRGIRRLGAD